MARPDAAVAVLVALSIVAGVWIRSQSLGFPGFMQLDEDHFVLAARALLEGKPDPNDHPPLGKLLIAGILAIFGDAPTHWRLSSLAFGVGCIAIAHRFATRLFGDPKAGWLAAMLIAVDGFFIAYSRLALLDGVLTTLMLGAVTLALGKHKGAWIAAGVVAGMAASVKLSGVTILVPILVALAWSARSPRHFLGKATGAIACAVGAFWMAGLVAGLMGHVDQPWLYAWNDARADVLNHMGAANRAHPMTSRWYTWFLPETLVNFSFVLQRDGTFRMLSMLGNLLLWWASPLCVAAGLVLALHRVLFRRAEGATRWDRCKRALGHEALRSWGLLALLWIVPLIPWMLSDRDSYVYHYMPTYVFGVAAVAGWLAKAQARAPTLTLAVLSSIVVVSAFYAPLWGQFPMGYDALDLRMFLWR